MVVRAFWLTLSAALTLCAPHPGAASPFVDTLTARSGTVLAHPVVYGAAGPFARVGVVLDRKPAPPGGSFSGRLVVDGSPARVLALSGPSEPEDFFVFNVKAVMFARVGVDPGNAVIVLYDSSRIGPGHGTDHAALVFRVTANGATRVADVERRLAGSATADEVRRRLHGHDRPRPVRSTP